MAGARGLYLRVGMLALIGAALAVGFVVFLAGGRGLKASLIYESYVEESVQGLDVGAPVRYRGVAVGRVTQIGLVSAEYRPPPGASDATSYQQIFVRFGIDMSLIGEERDLSRAIEIGLRARIRAQGITGVNYVELDYANPQRFPPGEVAWVPRNPVVPAIPSTVAQVTGAAELLVGRVTALPLEDIAADLSALLANLRRQTGDGDFAVTMRETAATVALIRTAIEQSDLIGALTEIRTAATEARTLLAGPEMRRAVNNIAGAAEDLRRTAQRLPGAVDGMERTMRAARETTVDVQAELLPVLIDLRATTTSLRAMAEQLRSSPSQTLFGAPPTPDRRR